MTSYLDLDDFVETAAELLALPEETVVKMARLDLAESALHAPQAGWGEVEFYPAGPVRSTADVRREEPSSACGPSRGAPAENLEAVEAEVAGWIAERLRPRPSSG